MCHVIDSMLYPPENTLVQFSLYPLKVKNIDISQALSIGGYKRWHTLVSFILCRNIDTVQGFNSGVFFMKTICGISPRRFSDIQNKTLDNGHSHKKYLRKWTHILLCANRKKILLHRLCCVVKNTHSVGHSRYSTWSVEIPVLLYLFVELYIQWGLCHVFISGQSHYNMVTCLDFYTHRFIQKVNCMIYTCMNLLVIVASNKISHFWSF